MFSQKYPLPPTTPGSKGKLHKDLVGDWMERDLLHATAGHL